ncbi:MAG: hypothetical protein K2Q01_06635 [Rickettsiales bacterium]|nr:hypothetical protein [Rickettsiales bacterium]
MQAERAYLLKTPMVGKRMMHYLDGIGIRGCAQLASMDAAMLSALIAHHSGLPGWETHSMARQAVANVVAAAKAWQA